MTNSSYRTHTDPLFTQLNILHDHKIITFAKLIFMHSIYTTTLHFPLLTIPGIKTLLGILPNHYEIKMHL